MKTFKLFSKVLAGFFLVCSVANSTLIDRGNEMIYNDHLDITWLLHTDFGKSNWQAANAWAEAKVHAGYDDWRLPFMPQMDPTCISKQTIDNLKYTNCSGDEMGHIYHTELGNDYAPDFKAINGNNFGPFTDLIRAQLDGFWTSTKFDPTLDWPTDTGARIPGTDDFHWLFYLPNGVKFVFRDGNSRHAIAVRDGDVVPSDSSGTLNDDLSFHAPSLDFQTDEGVLNIWANLSRYGTGSNNELLWGLDAWGINETALTGSKTGEVSEDLSLKINSVHFQDSTFWATFEYFGIDNETHLWVLKEFGENP